MLVHFGAFSGPHEALAELLDKPLRILKEDCWWEPRRIGGLRNSSNGWGCTPPTGTQQQWKIRRFMGVHTKKSDTPGSDYCDWVYPNQRSWKTTAAKWTKWLEVWILARLKLFHRGQRPHPWHNLRTQPWDVRIYCQEALACFLLDSRVRYVTKKKDTWKTPQSYTLMSPTQRPCSCCKSGNFGQVCTLPLHQFVL